MPLYKYLCQCCGNVEHYQCAMTANRPASIECHNCTADCVRVFTADFQLTTAPERYKPENNLYPGLSAKDTLAAMKEDDKTYEKNWEGHTPVPKRKTPQQILAANPLNDYFPHGS